jgi:hypothetical protein
MIRIVECEIVRRGAATGQNLLHLFHPVRDGRQELGGAIVAFFFAPGLKRFPKPSGLPPMAVVFFRSHTIELVVVSRL